MSQQLKDIEKQHIMQTYKRFDIVIEKGEGCYVYDTDGNKYLDFIGGVATCTVGHSNPDITAAITQQAGQLIAVSNLYYTIPQVHLAQKLSELSGLQKVFFCHAGADANEAAIKLAKKLTGKTGFISFKDAFHGRTTGSLALTWTAAYKKPFLPLAPRVMFAEYDDAASMEALIDDDTAAVIVEPIQGEAGIVVPSDDFLKQVRDICTKHKILMIVDEVQTGMGRTGTFFAYQQAGIKPDIVTIAKGLANGLPIGACLSDKEFAKGDHGATLGGNNLSAAAALATISYIEDHQLVQNAANMGAYFAKQINDLKKTTPLIAAVRGKGLMMAVVLNKDRSTEIVEKSLKKGFLCNAPTASVLRFLPPLTVTKAQIDEAIAVLKEVMA